MGFGMASPCNTYLTFCFARVSPRLPRQHSSSTFAFTSHNFHHPLLLTHLQLHTTCEQHTHACKQKAPENLSFFVRENLGFVFLTYLASVISFLGNVMILFSEWKSHKIMFPKMLPEQIKQGQRIKPQMLHMLLLIVCVGWF